jgi:hypothetical protein
VSFWGLTKWDKGVTSFKDGVGGGVCVCVCVCSLEGTLVHWGPWPLLMVF